MANRIPAEVFPPGKFIADELDARGWGQIELAEILNLPARLVSELVSGKRAITLETARGLGTAFGTGPQFWLNLEHDYQLSKASNMAPNEARQKTVMERVTKTLRSLHTLMFLAKEADVAVEEVKEFLKQAGIIVLPPKDDNPRRDDDDDDDDDSVKARALTKADAAASCYLTGTRDGRRVKL